MSFKTFLLWLLVLACGTFIYLKVSSLGSEDSYFNQSTRFKLGRYAVARTILGLHRDGDARASYLLAKSGTVTLEVVKSEGLEVPQQAIDDFVAKVKEYTGKQMRVVMVDTVPSGALNNAQLANVVRTKRRHSYPGEPNMFVMYVNDYEGAGEEVGRTYQEYGILVSHAKLADLTRRFPSALPQYFESTLLHEYGHQLGLGHVDGANCVMNKEVESPQGAEAFGGSFTPTSFCPQELEQLERIKQSLSY